MFTISSKGTYGLSAVFELGLQHNKGPIQIKAIAESQNIPQHYLEQLLVKLKKSGLVKSFRGAQGGYILAKEPAEITVYDVLKCLEGEQVLVNDPGENRALQSFWKKASDEVEELFKVSIEKLIFDHYRIEKQIVFNI
ncbi:MAG: Rrf2 family transcriptional regulator [bacterium]|nr:Rrf2 family transcriptional regulator [bacterium]